MDNDERIKQNRAHFEANLKKIQPGIEKMIRDAVGLGPGTAITGFIFGQKPAGLIRFGNIGSEGEQLVDLHVVLSSLAVEMKAGVPLYKNVPFANVGLVRAAGSENPEDIADALAAAILMSGMDESRIDQVLTLAQEYVMARRPNEPKS